MINLTEEQLAEFSRYAEHGDFFCVAMFLVVWAVFMLRQLFFEGNFAPSFKLLSIGGAISSLWTALLLIGWGLEVLDVTHVEKKKYMMVVLACLLATYAVENMRLSFKRETA